MYGIVHLAFILLFSFSSILNARAQNNDSYVVAFNEATKRTFTIEIDTLDLSIKVTKLKSGKVKMIKKSETKRIKVYTYDKRLYRGKWEILDANTIRVKKRVVLLSDIKNIKKQKVSPLARGGIAAGIIGLIIFGLSNMEPSVPSFSYL